MAGSKNSETTYDGLVRALAAATFLIFFQAYMVAPLIPRLASELGVSTEAAGAIVPAYLIPYGCATLVYGILSDRVGRARLILGSLLAFSLLTALTATAQNVSQLVAWRLVTGVGAGAVVPVGLVEIGALFPFERRGRPLGWLFGAMAGGMAFGSTLGAVLEPYVGWRIEFALVGVLGGVAWLTLLRRRRSLGAPSPTTIALRQVLRGYVGLLGTARGRRTYGFVLLNAMFHAGTFTWLGVYLVERYRLGEPAIGLAILGYGVPGFLFGPILGRAADRWGRGRLIPVGLVLSSAAAVALAPRSSVAVAVIAITVLSLGYDMTQPMFAGIVTSLGGPRPGQAMGLNVFALFVGFGLGSLAFGALIQFGFVTALAIFAAVELVLTVVSLFHFSGERPQTPLNVPSPQR